jgi:hypothetical protein
MASFLRHHKMYFAIGFITYSQKFNDCKDFSYIDEIKERTDVQIHHFGVPVLIDFLIMRATIESQSRYSIRGLSSNLLPSDTWFEEFSSLKIVKDNYSDFSLEDAPELKMTEIKDSFDSFNRNLSNFILGALFTKYQKRVPKKTLRVPSYLVPLLDKALSTILFSNNTNTSIESAAEFDNHSIESASESDNQVNLAIGNISTESDNQVDLELNNIGNICTRNPGNLCFFNVCVILLLNMEFFIKYLIQNRLSFKKTSLATIGFYNIANNLLLYYPDKTLLDSYETKDLVSYLAEKLDIFAVYTQNLTMQCAGEALERIIGILIEEEKILDNIWISNMSTYSTTSTHLCHSCFLNINPSESRNNFIKPLIKPGLLKYDLNIELPSLSTRHSDKKTGSDCDWYCNCYDLNSRNQEIIEEITVSYKDYLVIFISRNLGSKKNKISVVNKETIFINNQRYNLIVDTQHRGPHVNGGHYLCQTYEWELNQIISTTILDDHKLTKKKKDYREVENSVILLFRKAQINEVEEVKCLKNSSGIAYNEISAKSNSKNMKIICKIESSKLADLNNFFSNNSIVDYEEQIAIIENTFFKMSKKRKKDLKSSCGDLVKIKISLKNTNVIKNYVGSTQGSGFCGPLTLIQAKYMKEMIGEKIGIVGRTGAGKSTISLAITRIVEIFQG